MTWEYREPREPDWKEYVEPQLAHDSTPYDRALHETDCPGCGRHINAMIVDGPDPVFVELGCIRCGHRFTERITTCLGCTESHRRGVAGIRLGTA